jgi:hypothetical protein
VIHSLVNFHSFQCFTVGNRFALVIAERKTKMTLRIQRSSKEESVVLSLTGRIEAKEVAELRRLFSLEEVGRRMALDLEDVTLLDRDAVKFLASCEADSIKLDNCPAYIRAWIDGEKKQE